MVHVLGGHGLERGRPLLAVVMLALPVWGASCADGDDDDSGTNDAGAGMSSAAMGGGAGTTSDAGAPTRGGSASSGSGSGNGGTSSAVGGGSTGGNGGMNGASGGSAGLGGSGSGNGGSGSGGGAGATGASSQGGAGGSEPGAGRSGVGGDAGTGGGSSIGGRGPMPGFECGETTCMVGQNCVACGVGVTPTYELRCTPDQEGDPDGYAQAIKDCQMVNELAQCDGPEDCPADEHCVYTEESRGRPVCETEPEVGVGARCCFSCDAQPVCTLCWSDADCPETFICVRNAGQPADGPGGCRLAE
jgi:hypothetical protein